MFRLVTEAEQFHQKIFGGRFQTNKPIYYQGEKHVSPRSNIFYWSHGKANEDIEFPLHPHEGFEIFSFIIEGENLHFDTETKVWTPLYSGDFQVVRAGSGVYHSEKLLKGTRAFQIWFDPNFQVSLRKNADYADYKAADFKAEKDENNVAITQYVGGEKGVKVATEGLNIRKMEFEGTKNIALENDQNYGFYLLKGNAKINGFDLLQDDVMMISNENTAEIELSNGGSFFIIQMPISLTYKTIWN